MSTYQKKVDATMQAVEELNINLSGACSCLEGADMSDSAREEAQEILDGMEDAYRKVQKVVADNTDTLRGNNGEEAAGKHALLSI